MREDDIRKNIENALHGVYCEVRNGVEFDFSHYTSERDRNVRTQIRPFLVSIQSQDYLI